MELSKRTVRFRCAHSFSKKTTTVSGCGRHRCADAALRGHLVLWLERALVLSSVLRAV